MIESLSALRIFLVISTLLTATSASASTVPAFADVTGHAFGERITVHHQMVAFVDALAAASPRVEVVRQGESWEGRELLLAIVTSPENHRRLDDIRRTAQMLGDPRQTDPAELDSLISGQPAIVWLGGSIHGFELSGSEGLMKLLERLAGSDDEAVLEILDAAVVLIDPMLNPDGRDAFAHYNHQRIGRRPNPLRADWSHAVSSWQALHFRTGHYFFDTNRDWFAHTQRETRARVGTLREWRPQVVIDAHEMGPDVEFYFDPPTDPYGPNFPDFARRWFRRFGAAYAGAFDAAGFEYTTRELFNFFYPGYTTSYGSYQGAVGMLYEQGSSRGLALHRADESVRSLADALEQQYTAAWTAVRFAAGNREALLREYHDAHRAAVADGGQGVRWYFLGTDGDPGMLREAVDLLRRNGIEVGRLSADTELTGVRDRWGKDLGARTLAAGTAVVAAAQPRNRLIRALLEPDQPLPADFLAAARKRLDRGENPRFYDITSWSLPLLFDLEGYSATHRGALATEDFADDEASTALADDVYAYLVDGRSTAALAVLHQLKELGFRASVLLEPSRVDGRDIAAGSVVVRVGQNHTGTGAAVRDLGERFGVAVSAVATGLSEEGFPSLGSVRTVSAREVDVALLAQGGVHAYSFGWAWYTLDRQYGIDATVLPARTVAETPLGRFETLVIPDLRNADQLAAVLGEDGIARLRRWVRDGGTLVAIGAGVDFVRQKLELTALRSWAEENEIGEGEEARGPRRFRVPGAIFDAETDREVWLTAGLGTHLPFLVDSDRVYLAPDGPPNADRRVAVSFPAEQEDLRYSGHVWPETLERVPSAVLAYDEKIGRGRVVAFAEDLNYRGYWRGADRLFLNAVLLGPSAP
ncbi:MAG: M14 family zinc carboxypeptidase [Thermoanaerobaculia bacterium]